MKKATVYSAAIVRHTIANFNKEDIMSDVPLHNELGLGLTDRQKDKPNTSREDDVCKKCGATMFGALTGRQRSPDESNEGKSKFKFAVTPYCLYCDKKPSFP